MCDEIGDADAGAKSNNEAKSKDETYFNEKKAKFLYFSFIFINCNNINDSC